MFRIGEFSKIAQVSGRLLRYYDELGLLTPVYIDPHTGYRYYSAQQLPRLNHILALKGLGLSLEQVTRLLDGGTSIDEIRAMLTLRKAQIEQTVQEEVARLQMVESRLEALMTLGQLQAPDVVVKAVPPQPFLAVREVLPNLDAVRRLVQRIAAAVPAALDQHSLGYLAVVVHSPVYDPEAHDLEIGYLLTGKAPESVLLSEERLLTVRELPAVDAMATLVHVGRTSDCHQSYSALGSWLERHRWQFNGTGREILMQLPSSGNDDQAVVELQIPARRSSEPFRA